MTDHVDVIIVGAGLSGIDAAYHVGKAFPDKSYALLDMRGSLGGTWDLFRYPGIRSDSDMHTLGFGWKPWRGNKAIVDGPDILAYLKEAAAENGIDEHIRYHHKVVHAEFSTADARWTVTVERADTGETIELTSSFLWSTSGYYNYERGYTPDFEGRDDFEGQVVHPQDWPEDLDYAGKRVVVIGSGATAVTLIPALANSGAGHVTMLQRTPSYIISQPEYDHVSARMYKTLPDGIAKKLIRTRYLTSRIAFYEFCQARPKESRALLRKLLERQLPDDVNFDEHFKPPYDPWDQRLCAVPGGDLFKALRHHTVDIVTDHIDRFTPKGILLKSGKELEADIIITATGLNLNLFGGATLGIDGAKVNPADTMAYKGLMLSEIPNFAFIIGYTNASWTLKADLVCEYVVKVLRQMDATGARTVVPRRDPSMAEEPFLDFEAGYVMRSIAAMPKQGTAYPWRLKMNYFKDVLVFRKPVDDPALEFSD
ncbi:MULTISPECIES: flavin-containing monooxygenase [unclassified Nocardioides]|uniref:flavin-containing monooxygenase n=1 Tax=unclassified Nocardioides TaxID=2615069 RepID=UPI0006F453E9|nr:MULTISPECIES: NAD(P)/FAD-dependent oxidoreductase [unclassified Nocardioides]KRA38797.1 FAD-containing monooxygenase EthA [Nocardioides sp. Root614]KRA92757.1 FAD-containing monooxygenase EthA [Nocardioides sp. Root682]